MSKKTADEFRESGCLLPATYWDEQDAALVFAARAQRCPMSQLEKLYAPHKDWVTPSVEAALTS